MQDVLLERNSITSITIDGTTYNVETTDINENEESLFIFSSSP